MLAQLRGDAHQLDAQLRTRGSSVPSVAVTEPKVELAEVLVELPHHLLELQALELQALELQV